MNKHYNYHIICCFNNLQMFVFFYYSLSLGCIWTLKKPPLLISVCFLLRGFYDALSEESNSRSHPSSLAHLALLPSNSSPCYCNSFLKSFSFLLPLPPPLVLLGEGYTPTPLLVWSSLLIYHSLFHSGYPPSSCLSPLFLPPISRVINRRVGLGVGEPVNSISFLHLNTQWTGSPFTHTVCRL